MNDAFRSRTLEDFQEPLVEWTKPRFGLFFSGMVPAFSTKAFDPGGEADPTRDNPLMADLEEHDLVPFLIRSISTRQLLTDALGMPPGQTWFWIGEERRRLLPQNPNGKPGDFDIICGIIRDGALSTEFLCGIEVKLRAVDSSGRPKSPPSGTGTTQAAGLVKLGFDRSLLVHCLTAEGTAFHPHAASTWQGLVNAENPQAAAATINLMSSRLGPGAGYMALMLGQGIHRDYRVAHAAVAHVPRAPPTRPRGDSGNIVQGAAILRRGVEARLGLRRPGRFFVTGRGGYIECFHE